MWRMILILLMLSSPLWADSYDVTADNIEDTYLISSQPSTNKGSETTIYVGGSGNVYRGLIRFNNIADSLGAEVTIDSAALYLYCAYNFINEAVYAYRVVKPWDEADATWYLWDQTDLDWATDGCNNAADDDDNTGDGSGADRWATDASMYESTPIASFWYRLGIADSVVQHWYDGDWDENGLTLFEPDDAAAGFCYFYSTENASNKPYLRIWYHTEEEAPARGWGRGGKDQSGVYLNDR